VSYPSNNLICWINGAPLLVITGSDEFSLWLNGAPMLGTDESGPVEARYLSGTVTRAGFMLLSSLTLQFDFSGALIRSGFTGTGTLNEGFNLSGALTWPGFIGSGNVAVPFIFSAPLVRGGFVGSGVLVKHSGGRLWPGRNSRRHRGFRVF
jgi:hypothetical protein